MRPPCQARGVRADTRARHRADQKITDARLRLIRHLEALAYSDTRDVVQWGRHPEFDAEGNLLGWKDKMVVTPSDLLTTEQAAMVKSVTTKSGELKFEIIDRLQALAQLAKVLGVVAPDAPSTVTNTQVNVSQVNVTGETTALEAARRLAFALEKAARATAECPPPGTAMLSRKGRRGKPWRPGRADRTIGLPSAF